MTDLPPGRVRRTSLTNPTYRLTEQQRVELGLASALGGYSLATLAKTYGVSRKTVAVCRDRVLNERLARG